ncbi:sensory histidine kinase DcuS [compost metagenome]
MIFSDAGVGFDMEVVKDKIFGLHQKFNNHIDSKGIGLYLVHNHVTSLGGTIALESSINEGAKFIISFKQ